MDILKQLYFICPNPNVWDPHLSKDKQELESVQHFACKVCTKSWDDAYSKMPRTLNIPHALSERRKLLKMYHLCKIFHGFVDFPNHQYCTSLALIISQDIHILSHSYHLRHAQTLTIFPFSHTLSMFSVLTITYLYNLGTLYYIILAFAILCIHCTSCIKFH